MKKIFTLMIDDSPEFLNATGNFLLIFSELELIGQVRWGGDALAQIHQLKPDLILLDLALPDISGLKVLKQIKALDTPPIVIVLTLYDNPEYRLEAESLGADGYVLKADLTETLMPTIRGLFAEFFQAG